MGVAESMSVGYLMRHSYCSEAHSRLTIDLIQLRGESILSQLRPLRIAVRRLRIESGISGHICLARDNRELSAAAW